MKAHTNKTSNAATLGGAYDRGTENLSIRSTASYDLLQWVLKVVVEHNVPIYKSENST